MARSRNIKPGFFKNDVLSECSFPARLLFAGLWTLADKEGRLEDRPKKIKGEIFPHDNLDVDQLLKELSDNKFIIRYQAGENKYIQIVTFKIHQNPHKNEVDSIIPSPEEVEKKPEPSRKGAKHSGLNPLTDSLNLIPETTPAAPVFEIPDWVPYEDWKDFMEVRKKLGAAQTKRALNSIVNELERLRTKGHDPGEVLQQSIRSSWKDVWPIKEKNNGNSRNTRKPTPEDARRSVLAEHGIIEDHPDHPPGGAVLRDSGHLRQITGPVESPDEGDDRGPEAVQSGEDSIRIPAMAAGEHEDPHGGGYFKTYLAPGEKT